MEYEVTADREGTGIWRVEAINYDGDGEVYVAIFTGLRAKFRAYEYADIKNAQMPEPHSKSQARRFAAQRDA